MQRTGDERGGHGGGEGGGGGGGQGDRRQEGKLLPLQTSSKFVYLAQITAQRAIINRI